MTSSNTLPVLLALALAAGSATAQQPGSAPAAHADAARDGEWVSYRDAYRAMLWFEKYGKPKQLIQNHYQVAPKERAAANEAPLRLTLVSKSLHVNLPLDATGRAAFPLLKAAYDENAELTLNRKVSQFVFRSRVSIVVRADGVYEAAELRSACEQVLAYQRFLDAGYLRGKKCAGVRFVYARGDAEAQVEWRRNERERQPLAGTDGSAFWDETGDGFRVFNYQFAAWPDKGQLTTRSAPLAIAAIYD